MPINTTNIEKTLLSLGISDKEAKFYLALLQSGPSTVLPVARLAGLRRTSVYNFVDELVSVGLVTFFDKNNRRYYRAENPETALKLLDDKRQNFSAVLPDLVSLYKNNSHAPETRNFFGPEGVRFALRSGLDCVGKKIYAFIDMDSAVTGTLDAKFWEEYIDTGTERGIIIHSIRHRDEKTRFTGYKYLKRETAQKTLLVYRYLPQKVRLPNTILVFDNTVVIVSPPKENWAMIVESESLAATMKSIHNLFWQLSR